MPNAQLQQLFSSKSDILSIFFTAGYPQLNSTVPVLHALQKAGADLVEVGMPFSDPIADGETIQQSSSVALKNGMRLQVLFEQLAEARAAGVTLPLVLMGYINPVLQFGMERFCQQCEAVGIAALILPDLPMFEYQSQYKPLLSRYGLSNIFLVSPQTSEARIAEIDEQSEAFIYLVSSNAITGAKKGISDQQKEYFVRIKSLKLRNPQLIGFGIGDAESFATACRYSSGAIVGSAFIKALAAVADQPEKLEQQVVQFVQGLRGEASS